ncbi:MAG TPA: AarF/UbiB family protein [Acidimicrobiales bacterium]|jgi:predicted unusual protein kinase regulating ubiquinone biosynthesis (AarF/ABC1/UbiB family)/CBS domain-containing protein
MAVAEAMQTNVPTVAPGDTVAEGARRMHAAGTGAVVVIDDGVPVGVLTERDLVRLVSTAADPMTSTVAEWAASPAITIDVREDVLEAREQMGRHGIRHLPVVDGGRLVGLIEQTDPRFGLHFDPDRARRGERRLLTLDPTFRGPYAEGPPSDDLVADAPPIDVFGWAELRRMIVIYTLLIFHVLRAVLARRLQVVRRQNEHGWFEAASHGAVDAFVALGPTFVKLGQLIASSPGVFPAPLADACQRCLDDVPPFDSEVSRRVIRDDLGREPEEIFRHFEDRPLSAASIGQVHAVVLPDGRRAVVKLQRPRIVALMTVDLRIMHRLARLMTHVDALASANPVGVIEDLHAITFQELNPALEAKRQYDFRANIGAFGDNAHITAPEVYWDYCGPHVICMERMSGIPMDEFDEMERRNVDGELVLRRGAKVWIESVVVHGPFHGDMHAGNIWVLDDGRSSYLDFGIMGELTPEFRDVVKDILYTCMIDGDFTRIARAYRNVGVFPDDAGTDEELGMRLGMILGPMLQAGIGGMNLGEMLKMSIDLMDSYAATAPREMMLIAKQLAYIERYAKGLAPEYAIVQDLFLIKNVFPTEVAAKAAELGVELPD